MKTSDLPANTSWYPLAGASINVKSEFGNQFLDNVSNVVPSVVAVLTPALLIESQPSKREILSSVVKAFITTDIYVSEYPAAFILFAWIDADPVIS